MKFITLFRKELERLLVCDFIGREEKALRKVNIEKPKTYPQAKTIAPSSIACFKVL